MLKSAKGFIRKPLADRIELRHIPELEFIYDESIEYGKKIEEKIKLYKKIYECLKENGQFINCDKIALSQEIEDGQLYELETNIENHGHIDTPLTVEHEIEVLKMVGFQEITSSNVDKDDYSLIKARKMK